MSLHTALAPLILAAGFTGYGILLALVRRADRAKARDTERTPEPEQADAETGPDDMRLAA